MVQTLKRGVQQGADSAAGWKALAELQYQSRMWTDAHATAVAGLEWSVKRRSAPSSTVLYRTVRRACCAWHIPSGQLGQ